MHISMQHIEQVYVTVVLSTWQTRMTVSYPPAVQRTVTRPYPF